LGGNQNSRHRERQNANAFKNHQKLAKSCLVERYVHDPSVPDRASNTPIEPLLT
jgi:hypothetical protein